MAVAGMAAGAPVVDDGEQRAAFTARLAAAAEMLAGPIGAESAPAIGRALLTVTEVPRAAVFYRSPSGIVSCPWSHGLSDTYVRELVTPDGVNPWAHIMRHPELRCMDLPKGGRTATPGASLVRDIREWPSGSAEIIDRAEREGLRSICSWSLIRGGRVVGAVAYYYDAPHACSGPEQEVMHAFALQAATVIDHGIAPRARTETTTDAAVRTAAPAAPARSEGEIFRVAEPPRMLESAAPHLTVVPFESRERTPAVSQQDLALGQTPLGDAWASLETAYRRLIETQAALVAETARLTETRTGLDAAEAALNRDRERLEEEEARVAAARQDVEIVRAEVREAGAEVEQQQRQLLETRRAVDEERARLAEAQREHAAELNRLADGQTEVEAERTRLAGERAQLAAIGAELADEKARLSESEGRLREEGDRVAAARQELAAEEVRLAADKASLEAESRRLAEAQAAAAAENDRLAGRQRYLDAELARLTVERQEQEREAAHAGSLEAGTGEAATDEAARQLPAAAQRGTDDDVAPAAEAQADGDAGREAGHETPPDAKMADVPAPEAAGTTYKVLVERARAAGLPNGDGQITAVAQLLDLHDGHASGYGARLAEWAEALARALSCSTEEIQAARRAAFLHDIGKIDVPETTLRKATGLTADEDAMLRDQPIAAYRMLHDVPGLGDVATILRHRFEQWNGTGRPDGLKGDLIPLGARILAVVETYGEMLTGRPGGPKLYYRDAISVLRGRAGTRFDPKVADTFCQVVAPGIER